MDISEPLLAIAEMAGSDWPERTRAALIEAGTLLKTMMTLWG